MLMSWDSRLFIKGDMHEARLILFCKIMNGLAQVPSMASLLRRIRTLEENTL